MFKKAISILAAAMLLTGTTLAEASKPANPCIPCDRIKLMCCNWMGADFCEEQRPNYQNECWRTQYERYCRGLLANFESMMGPEEYALVQDYLHTECPHKQPSKPTTSKCSHQATTCKPTDKNHHERTCTKCGVVVAVEACSKKVVSSYADHTSDGKAVTTYEKKCSQCGQYSWSYVN